MLQFAADETHEAVSLSRGAAHQAIHGDQPLIAARWLDKKKHEEGDASLNLRSFNR